MLASPILSPASSTRSLPPRLPEANSSRRNVKLQSNKSPRFSSLHVYMGFMMSIIGAGMLSVPYTLVLIPMWQALAGIAFVGVAMSCTANALLHAYVHAAARAEFEAHALGAGSKFVGFQALARRAGGPALGYTVSLIMASGIYGGCVANIQIIRDITPFVVELVYDGLNELPGSEREHVKQVVMWVLLAVVLLPLCMLRKLSALQPTNYVSFVLSIYLVGAVAYRSIEGYQPSTVKDLANNSTTREVDEMHNISSGSLSEVDVLSNLADTSTEAATLQGNSFTRLAQSISIYNFAFMMTLNLLPLFVQLLKANGGNNVSRGGAMRNFTTFVTAPPLLTTRSQMMKCIFGASFICAVLYGAIACAAFDLYGDDIDGNILLNLQSDSAMEIPLVATYITVLFTFPLLFLPLRSLIEELLDQTFQQNQSYTLEYGQYPGERKTGDDRRGGYTSLVRLTIVLALLCSQQIIALNVSGIEAVFSLMGATSCLVICYVFPVIAFTTVYPWRRARYGFLWFSMLWAIVCVVTIQGATCVWLLLTS
ncbi:Sodium-coupled neutral amino acid transporter 3 [Phytophthora ramorum]|uniref:Amino acid transporter transmembrane domain-containing protein n=1 Tax=Phytophthora ramorum TaxID=164328 RepID=H3GGE7_PHYRM|nr:Sodium-coupled neutral amino acid transporter 3 [Phytophthora ramorum]